MTESDGSAPGLSLEDGRSWTQCNWANEEEYWFSYVPNGRRSAYILVAHDSDAN